MVLEGQSYAFALFDECLKSASLDVLHPDDEALVSFEEGIKFDDVSMVDCCQYLSLLGK